MSILINQHVMKDERTGNQPARLPYLGCLDYTRTGLLEDGSGQFTEVCTLTS